MRDIKSAFCALADLLFPRLCAVCGERLEEGEIVLCNVCKGDFPLTWHWAWGENPAEKRMWERVGIVSAATLYFYRGDDGYSSLVRRIKYGGDVRLGMELGRMLGRNMRASGRFGDIQAVTAVPLHPLRRLKRGYNQAAVIARGVAAGLRDEDTARSQGAAQDLDRLPGPAQDSDRPPGSAQDSDSDRLPGAAANDAPAGNAGGASGEAPGGSPAGAPAAPVFIDGILRRRRHTSTQTRLDRHERALNVKGAFCINRRRAAALKRGGIVRILVVDDVLTSGATLSAAVTPLMEDFRISVATLGFVE